MAHVSDGGKKGTNPMLAPDDNVGKKGTMSMLEEVVCSESPTAAPEPCDEGIIVLTMSTFCDGSTDVGNQLFVLRDDIKCTAEEAGLVSLVDNNVFDCRGNTISVDAAVSNNTLMAAQNNIIKNCNIDGPWSKGIEAVAGHGDQNNFLVKRCHC